MVPDANWTVANKNQKCKLNGERRNKGVSFRPNINPLVATAVQWCVQQ